MAKPDRQCDTLEALMAEALVARARKHSMTPWNDPLRLMMGFEDHTEGVRQFVSLKAVKEAPEHLRALMQEPAGRELLFLENPPPSRWGWDKGAPGEVVDPEGLVHEDGIPTLKGPFWSGDLLADAFTLIERHNVMVATVRVNPETFDAESKAQTEFWGAQVEKNEDQPVDVVDLLIDDGAVKARIRLI